ncbi:MAG: hypothetical protein ACREOW_04800 [Thermodesulfobacteriota bacterium]
MNTELIESAKEMAWEKHKSEVERMTDRLGKEIDEGIKETVIALRAIGFPTSQSCEGHTVRGLPYPWVDITAPTECTLWWSAPTPGYEKRQELANLKLEQRMVELLAEFYENRQTPFDARLSFVFIRKAFRVQSIGGRTLSLLSPEEKEMKIGIYKKEMEDFARFLKQKYFSSP